MTRPNQHFDSDQSLITFGHPLGPNEVLVGHVACLGHGGGGHTALRDATVFGHHLSP